MPGSYPPAHKATRQTYHKIYLGDSRRMHKIKDASVHLVVTSPPYWQLKDYGIETQIGYNDTYENYINSLNLVWQECHRVLHPGCRLCINVGDQYARAAHYGRYKVIPIRTEIIKFCEACGFDYMGAVIWQKTGTMNPSGGGAVMGSFPYPRNGILKLDYEFILVFKKQGRAPKPSAENKKLSALTPGEWNSYFAGHWNFAGAKQDKHLAMFPTELPLRLIRMFSFVGDTVLDPFAGSGTVNAVARDWGRSSAGYEINPEFIQLIKDRLTGQLPLASPQCQYTFAEDKASLRHSPESIARLYAKLPYRFSDPHRITRKVDPLKMTFGSKISREQEAAGQLGRLEQPEPTEQVKAV